MSWIIGDDEDLFIKMKAKLGFYHVGLTTSKASPKNFTFIVVQKQQLPNIEFTDSTEESSCLDGQKEVCVNFKTDTDKLNIAVYRYRNSSYIEDKKIYLKLTEYQTLSTKRVFVYSDFDISYKRFIVLDETTVRSSNFLSRKDVLFFSRFSDCSWN